MSTVIIDGLDHRTTNDIVEKFCQSFGRILNCYLKSNQCTVIFADQRQAEEFVRTSPHRIDTYSYVYAKPKATLNRSSSSGTSNSTENCRLIIRGTSKQLEEKNLVDYFSQFGHIRMCQPCSSANDSAIITFDDSNSCERVLKQSRHFLHGRSLIIEPYSSSNKRRKCSDTNDEKTQSISDQQRIQLHENEKQQWRDYITQQHNNHLQQICQYQIVLKQSVDEILVKDRQIEQLKRENKDIDELLRQSVHDNGQQQIHLRKREDIHNQTKRKYEELYKAYTKLRDHE